MKLVAPIRIKPPIGHGPYCDVLELSFDLTANLRTMLGLSALLFR